MVSLVCTSQPLVFSKPMLISKKPWTTNLKNTVVHYDCSAMCCMPVCSIVERFFVLVQLAIYLFFGIFRKYKTPHDLKSQNIYGLYFHPPMEHEKKTTGEPGLRSGYLNADVPGVQESAE